MGAKLLTILGHGLFWMILAGVLGCYAVVAPGTVEPWLTATAKAAGIIATALMDPSHLMVKLGFKAEARDQSEP